VSAVSRLLLAVTADGDAAALVDYAHRMHQAVGGHWSVVGLDDPQTESRAPAQRAALLEALDRAERLGATVGRISTGTHSPSGLVSSLVHRARSEQATMLMVGRPPQGRIAMASAGGRLSQFADVLTQLLPGVTVHVIAAPRAGASPSAAGAPAAWPALRWPSARSAATVLLTLALVTAAGVLLERHVHPANLVMIFLAGVVYVASRAGRAAAVVTVLGSIFVYDLYFVAPRWSLKPTEPQYWIAFVVMMLVGVMVSHFAARSREQALLAEARAQRAQALNQLALALAKSRTPEAVCDALQAALHSALGVSARAARAVGDGATSLAPLDESQRGFGIDAQTAALALREGREAGAGTPLAPHAPLRYVPLLVGVRAVAVLVLPPPAPARDTLEDRHLLRALANQAAVALERALFERRSVETAIEAERERLRSTLLAGISHDFRTPLTTIVGSATTLLQQGPALDASHREALLRGLLAEAQRLHGLTSNLLDLTRLEEGAIQLWPEWCPADELLEEALAALGPRRAALQIDTDVPGDALVWCDPRLVGQVIVNLLDNAQRHTPPSGRVRVRIEVAADTWCLVVHDQGPGIPAGQEEMVFRKFYRARSDGDSAGKGLGLAICAAVAELHGGSIRAANDGGARFVMSLPQPELPAVGEAGEVHAA
jgi:two-component system sensor histidine kinase KdpD